MQEEVNQKVISLSIQGVKITASVLKAALRKFLEMDNRRKQKATQVKMAEKTGRAQEKGREQARKKIEKKKPHGKQTIKQLNAQGVQLSNLKITDENIKSFDRVARKYGIDYSLKKDVGADPPKYLVFFKAKDVDVMTAAFREYAGVELKKETGEETIGQKETAEICRKKSKAPPACEAETKIQRSGTMMREKLQKIQVKRLVILNLPYFFIFYVADKGSWLYRHCLGESMVQRLGVMLVNFRLAFLSWLPSIALQDLTVGVLVASALKLVVYYRSKNAKKFRQGVEYGSARWGNRKDIEPFMDPVFENNVILTETERLTMNSRPKAPKYARNKNVIVIGGSGSGKTRFYVKPNLMQMTDHVSYVVTDPKGTIIVECGKMLVNGGYRIKVLNTINFKKSMHYNPFHYIRSEKDILKLVNTIIANTKGEGEKSTEDFWVKAERLLYSALIGYIWYEAPEEEQNFSTLLEFINASETREDDEEFKNAVDELFEELEAENPEHFAVRQYRKYKLAAGKTAKSILISCGARLAPFDIQELREIMSYDEMELDMIGDQRTAMFVIISDTDDTFNFVVAIMYTQLFNLLCDKADDEHGGRLPYHVRLLLDEFSNIGQIPKFDKLIATIRSREISASIILQSQSQLKTIYKDAAETITGNCDTVLFLGGKESSTLKEISETLGKETIDLYNTSDTRGSNRSYGLNYQKTGKELMSRDELAVMDGEKCILQLRGVRPFLSNKYDITKHKRYKELADFNKNNAFDVEKYLAHRLVMSEDTEFEMYEVTVTQEDVSVIEAEEGED